MTDALQYKRVAANAGAQAFNSKRSKAGQHRHQHQHDGTACAEDVGACQYIMAWVKKGRPCVVGAAEVVVGHLQLKRRHGSYSNFFAPQSLL